MIDGRIVRGAFDWAMVGGVAAVALLTLPRLFPWFLPESFVWPLTFVLVLLGLPVGLLLLLGFAVFEQAEESRLREELYLTAGGAEGIVRRSVLSPLLRFAFGWTLLLAAALTWLTSVMVSFSQGDGWAERATAPWLALPVLALGAASLVRRHRQRLRWLGPPAAGVWLRLDVALVPVVYLGSVIVLWSFLLWVSVALGHSDIGYLRAFQGDETLTFQLRELFAEFPHVALSMVLTPIATIVAFLWLLAESRAYGRDYGQLPEL